MSASKYNNVTIDKYFLKKKMILPYDFYVGYIEFKETDKTNNLNETPV